MAYNTAPFAFRFSVTPWVRRLLIANGVVFLITLLAGQTFRPAIIDWFAFHPNQVLTRPWGAVTYMFLHGDLWHLLLNMLVLFFFGPPLEERWGSREFLKFYFICGLGGVALSFLFASGASVIGASAAIYGVMLAFAMTWPESPIYVWGIFR
jgi:membrane associated rhomboid family serine protease